jgi:single-stranded DNA-binding protein
VVVEGKLITNNYTDKNDIKRYNTEIQVSDVLIVSHKK